MEKELVIEKIKLKIFLDSLLTVFLFCMILSRLTYLLDVFVPDIILLLLSIAAACYLFKFAKQSQVYRKTVSCLAMACSVSMLIPVQRSLIWAIIFLYVFIFMKLKAELFLG